MIPSFFLLQWMLHARDSLENLPRGLLSLQSSPSPQRCLLRAGIERRAIPSFPRKARAGSQPGPSTPPLSGITASSSCSTALRTRTAPPGWVGQGAPTAFTSLAAPSPCFSPETDYEKDGGVEDPRLVKFGDTFYLTYTGYNKKDAQLCLATSKTGPLATPGRDSAGLQGALERALDEIRGRSCRKRSTASTGSYFLGTSADNIDQMGLASSTDLIHWTEATDLPVLAGRPGQFDSRVLEPGPPPIVTKDGIVLVYNAADDKLVYRTAIAVFDRSDPRKLLRRSDQPVFFPEKDWEKVGQVPQCGLCGRHGPTKESLFVLLRCRRQIYRRGRGSGQPMSGPTPCPHCLWSNFG